AIGTGWLDDANELQKLSAFENNAEFLDKMDAAKREEKERLAAYVKKTTGVEMDTNTIFDTQVKRFHAYKRQLLNVFKILYLYNRMLDDPSYKPAPTTFIFSGKAAQSYTFAKEVIRLIHSVADVVNNDERIEGRLKIVFIPNFAVSNAQLIYAASDISEQISVAGAEASGTSNMKLMMNAALTLGTYDGSNIEISELAGPENIKIFGLRADEVQEVYASGTYFAQNLLNQNPTLARIVNMLTDGSLSRLSGNFESIRDYLLINNDPDLVLIDFDAYVKAWEELTQSYADRRSWNARALHNTANSGFFSADRTIREYMEDIWHV
ncbi:MAG: glycogen/starch/alpha-glucan phosphorylase, partial [Atopobium sp.]|nr:glycogen/starch/alpha-glucan phosphorylase [Atopobium sp.]